MTKLSKAQLAILRRMGEGHILRIGGMGYWSWNQAPYLGKGIRRDTVMKLWRLGLTEDYGDYSEKYRITPAGRAYLEENDVDS